MGQILLPDPVLPFYAIFGQTAESLAWAREQIEQHWGDIAISSPEFHFDQTSYYEKEMGSELRKQLVVLENLDQPEWLPPAKLQSNSWEEEYLKQTVVPEDKKVDRPLNIDPGYVTLAKLVLATTKDRDHRLYLGQGIFAEVTVHYKYGGWKTDRWTYPDFQTPEYHAFLDLAREHLKMKLKNR